MKCWSFIFCSWAAGWLALPSAVIGQSSEGLDKKGFYQAMSSGELAVVTNELQKVQVSDPTGQNAFLGGLTMKKAGLIVDPHKKLSLFKSGRTKLEAAIHASEENAEYRFVRLMVQEHAPAFLGYHAEIKADRELILKSFSHLPADTQGYILDYSKKSTILKPGDF